jgi:hypothetical protein
MSIVWMSEAPDAEPRPLLRHVRGLLTGYGEGWTLGGALWHMFSELLLVVACVLFIAALLVLELHLHR